MTTWHDQAVDAYRRMAREARYRPAAPSDGLGNITAPLTTLNLATEAHAYAHAWRADEDAQSYPIGCPSFADRETLILLIEAARLLCGVKRHGAATLLRMAIGNLEQAASTTEVEDLLGPGDVARLCGLGPERIRQLCQAGAFRGARKDGTHWRIPRHAVETWIRS